MKARKFIRILASCVASNTLMWYDYALFGSLVDIIGNTFFPSDAGQSVKLIAAFGAFASGFFMRPVGASFFGHIGDKFGRKKALFFSMLSMCFPTLMICFSPGYGSIGLFASVLLIVIRLLQGLSLGGEAGNAAYLVEHAGKNENSTFFSSFEVISAVCGSILATVVIGGLRYAMGEQIFVSWGWRVSFGLGFVMSIGSLLLRHRSEESPTYEEAKENDDLHDMPVKELFSRYRKNLLVAIGLDAVENGAFYMFLVFFSVFIGQIADIPVDLTTFSSVLISLFLAVMTLFFAFIADIFTPHKLLRVGFWLFLLTPVPIFFLLNSGNENFVLFAYMAFVIPFAASLGPINTAMSELFPTEVRYTGFGLARNISGAVFGGIAPVICVFLIELTDIKVMAGVYMMLIAIIGLVSLRAAGKFKNSGFNKENNELNESDEECNEL